jgi:hypothetical protein
LNQGDVFIVASDAALILWVGSAANLKEKLKGSQIVDVLKGKYKAATVTRLEGGETSPQFWALLGGEVPIASAAAGGADAEYDVANVKKIFAIDGGAFTLIAEGAAATKDKLTSDKAFVIQRGETVLVYFGNAVPQDVRKTGISKGVEFLASQGLPNYYEVASASEGNGSATLDIIFA